MLKMCLAHQGWLYELTGCHRADNPMFSQYIGRAHKGARSTMIFTKGSESDLLICCVTASAAIDEEQRESAKEKP